MYAEGDAFQVLLRDGEQNNFSRTTFTVSTDTQLNETNAGKTSLISLNCVYQ